ncbi:uncharacterized protein PADG_05487 [Paracoccidioides brasiliensis Pb18]|uniref:Uncharacterized protein n=1 Tax=Paracoccidioides brasiliensis (strain Pb18) TaxID=502780 RepID=C1GE01_PARBD|nr:uncharacterized protein PADG_05487 [Paracoccidioides brasiliensis Pb18]EEH49408.2 hypothetical protein PADG_05487 [Paracoccidioides brasiliensis Pb18]
MRHQDKHEDEELLQVTKGFILVVQAVDTPSVFEPESAMSTSGTQLGKAQMQRMEKGHNQLKAEEEKRGGF